MAGDPARLRQVLINLLGNAINYTERGGVGLCVHVEGASLRVDVHDTGPGVPAAAREAIFREFERGAVSVSSHQGGAGLGLAISRRLLDLMDGALTLAETSERGSTFSLWLPLGEIAPAPPTRPPLGRRVMIVGDSLFEAPYLARTLEAAGARTEIMARETAIARLSKREADGFDIAIIDCAMGAEAVAEIARIARAQSAARLFLLFSPLERRAFAEAALRDFDGWMVKPVRNGSLLERLSHFGGGSAGRVASPEPIPILKGAHVLAAEDNEVNALILTRALGKLGANVARARDGAQAVAQATFALTAGAAPYDVILMDLFMPDMDGAEATRQIRDVEARAGAPRTPIIALTASVLEADARRARAAGVDALLTKPVDLTALAATIDELRHSREGPLAGAPGGHAPVGAMVPNLPER